MRPNLGFCVETGRNRVITDTGTKSWFKAPCFRCLEVKMNNANNKKKGQTIEVEVKQNNTNKASIPECPYETRCY